MITYARLQELDALICPLTLEEPNHVPWLIQVARMDASNEPTDYNKDFDPSFDETLEIFPTLDGKVTCEEAIAWDDWRKALDDEAERQTEHDRHAKMFTSRSMI